ncbi:hypothetical protein B0H11DRAFT_2215528 [Mycena galericulata]|nr:hypothetical protein B0H11DRAFT_2215528 [Mycena galericulata]
MSDHRKHPKPNQRDKDKGERPKVTPKSTPAPSPQPSRSTTPAPSNRRGRLPGATILPHNRESAPRRVDNREDSLKGGDVAKTDNLETVQSMPGGTYNLMVSGGTGGRGGSVVAQGGQGGQGGTGEGPKIPIYNSVVNLTDPHATKLQFIKEKLANHVAAQHKFTDQSKSLCAPEPRTKEHIFGITGIAGSGKSTLSATVVDNLRKKHTPVAAQFFISRNIPETTDPDKIIPTIAQQLAAFSSDAARIIHAILEKYGCPSSQQEQVEELLLAPIRELAQSHTEVIILIDALDELQNAAKSVPAILALGRHLQVPNSGAFSVQIVVKEITPDEPGWENWPPPEELLKLSDKANGLFHYAATALHWIEDQIRNDGKTCQNTVFDQFTLLGIGELEALYEVILTSFEDIAKNFDKVADEQARAALKLRHKNRLGGFKHVIGTILVLYEPLTISQIMALLADIPVGDFDVGHFLRQMCSVLIPGKTTSFEEATPQMHKSFRDYIMDGHAPAEFCILTGHAHFVTARSCLEVIVNARSQSDVVNYSVRHWYKHLRKAVEGRTSWEDERMWNLFEQMVEESVVGVWKATSWWVFHDVAAAGWGLLKQGADKHQMEGISRILMKAKEVRASSVACHYLTHFPLPSHL